MEQLKTFINFWNRKRLALLFYAGLISSIIYSPFVLSVCMFAFLSLSLFYIQWEERFSFRIREDIPNYLNHFWSYRAFPVVTIGFFLVLFSGLWSEDVVYWWSRLRMKLPFLVLPLAFAAMPKLSEKEYYGVYYFLVFILFITCIGIGINYLLHFEEINQLLKQGQPMPTPRNHIRFSLLLALGIIAAGYLYVRNYYIWFPWERYWIGGIGLFSFFFIHLLSVRSGLMVLYVTLAILLIRYIYQSRRYFLGFILMLFLAGVPIIAYYTIPSLHAKINYAKYDLWMYRHGQGGDNSDSGRIQSLKIGWEVGNEYPLTGVGIGDLKKVIYERYEEAYPGATPRMPHNQLLFWYAGTGLIGLAIFLFAFFYPLFYRRNYWNSLFLGFHIIVFSSFLTENTIENSLGVAFYCFFLLLGLSFFSQSVD